MQYWATCYVHFVTTVILFIIEISAVWGLCPRCGSYADITCFTVLRDSSFETKEENVILLRHT